MKPQSEPIAWIAFKIGRIRPERDNSNTRFSLSPAILPRMILAGDDIQAKKPLSAGKHTIEVDFMPDAPQPGAPATVTLLVDEKPVADGHIDRQVPQRCGTETLDVGMDCVSPVCSDYADRGLFPFTGRITSVQFRLGEVPQVTGMERLEMATKLD